MYHPYYYSQFPYAGYLSASLGTTAYPDTIHLGGRVFSRSNYSTRNQPAQAGPSTPQPTQGQAVPVSGPSAGDPANATKPKSNLKKPQIFMSRAQQQQQQQPQAMAEDNGTASRQPTPNQPYPVSSQHHSPFHMFPFAPPYPGFPQQQNVHQSNAKQEVSPPQANLGALVHYPSPHPRMYPYVLPGTQPVPSQPSMMPTPNMGVLPGSGGHPSAHHQSQPSMTAFPPNLNPVPSMNAHMYGMPFSQVPSKLKCSECGRERSSKYQWKHRKSRGRKPELNICWRCRRSGTESEYESDDSEHHGDRLRRSRSHRHSGGRTSRTRSRARSSSRPAHRGDFDFYAYQGIGETDSDSEDSEDYGRKKRRSIRRRNRSTSEDSGRMHGSRTHRSISRPRRVVYVETPRDQVDLHSSEDNVEVRYVDHHAGGSLIMSRPSTPAVRAQRSLQQDHDFRPPIVIERREYYEEPLPSRHLTRPSSRPGLRRSHSHDFVVPLKDAEYTVEPYSVERGGRYHEIGTDGASRGRRLRSASRSRSRSHFSIDEGAESGSRDRLLHRVPSPPRTRRRSPAAARSDGSKEESDVERRGYRSHSRRSDRPRHRSDEKDGSQRASPPPADDYDWYDKDGMRVRVREI